MDVYAPGERLVNLFVDGPYQYMDPSETKCLHHARGDDGWYPDCPCVTAPETGTFVCFSGRARWSGTSFATPVVAGTLAAYLSANNLQGRPREAWRRLLAETAVRVPGAGPALIPSSMYPE
jgi:subtilisin family serine protease